MRSIILSLLILLVLFSTNAICEEPSLTDLEQKITEQRAALKEKPEDIELLLQLGASYTKQAEIYLKQAENSKAKKDKTENHLHARKAFAESLTLFIKGDKLAEQADLKLPKVINRDKEPTLYQERESINTKLMQLKLYLASVTYRSTKTYDTNLAAEKIIHDQKLHRAVELFEVGYQRWKTRLIGLYFLYYKAKALIELKDYKRADIDLEKIMNFHMGRGREDVLLRAFVLKRTKRMSNDNMMDRMIGCSLEK